MERRKMILDIVNNIIAPGKRCIISKALEESIGENLSERYGENWTSKIDIFYDAFKKIRKEFSGENYKDDVPYLYSMYYMLLNVPKVQLVILELLKKIEIGKTLKILDIGSSVGTSSIAIIDLFTLLNNISDLHNEESIVENIVIDSWEYSEDNIDVFKKNIKRFKEKLSELTHIEFITVNTPIQCDATSYNDDENDYDLVIISNMLNELKYNERYKLIKKLEGKLSENGNILIIEPATRKNTVELNSIKNEIVDNTSLKVVSPCTNHKKCENCWNFRTISIVNNSLFSHIDEHYSQEHKSKFEEQYYNNRLKWSYCILSKYQHKNNIISLNNYKVGPNKSIELFVASNEGIKNKATLCDGSGNKVNLKCKKYKDFSFGDSVIITNCILEKVIEENSDKISYEIELSNESNILNEYKNNRDIKTAYTNIAKKNINFLLNRLWGFSELRDGQFEIIEKALLNEDILGILPTGAGKSICYQLPAMIKSGVSIVISPLKSLIKDQVNNLHRNGFEFVDYIDSSRNIVEKDIVLKRFLNGSLKLLYVAPERLQMLDFQKELIKALKGFNIDYFIIDEAHCASEWGHDFRPAYLKLKDVVNRLGSCSILAVTATASPKVKSDILDIFNIKKDNVISSKSLDRDELSFEVININNSEIKDEELINQLNNNIPYILKKDTVESIHENGSGIVFTIYGDGKGSSTKNFSTTYLNGVVKAAGFNSNGYYSKLDEKLKIDIQDNFKDNTFPVLVSTKGFGMGIDKPNIRYIIHTCYPNSLEAYYQEAGRAGRDKSHAHSVIIAKPRLAKCSEEVGILESFEPSCVSRWTCKYTGGNKCDYGMQAKFISDDYPDYNTMMKKIDIFEGEFKNAYIYRGNGNKFKFMVDKDGSSEYQKYLFYFQKYDLIKNYHIIKYFDKKVELGIEIHKSITTDDVNNVKVKIVSRLQEFKKQKYNMLQSMWEYVKNEKQCRREYLMNYFQNDVFYGEEGCCFCDIEGISLDKKESSKLGFKNQKIYKTLQLILDSNSFIYEDIENLIKASKDEGIEDNIKIRSLRYLEDYTDSLTALYIVSYMELEKDIKNSYARNQVLQLSEGLNSKKMYKQSINIVEKFYELDKNLIIDIFKSSKNIRNDSEFIEEIIESNCTEGIKDIAYKSYIVDRFEKINKLFG